MYSHIDRLGLELAEKASNARKKLMQYPGTESLQGAIMKLEGDIAKHHWSFRQAVRDNREYSINQHANALHALERQLEKLLAPPGRLDVDLRLDLD